MRHSSVIDRRKLTSALASVAAVSPGPAVSAGTEWSCPTPLTSADAAKQECIRIFKRLTREEQETLLAVARQLSSSSAA